MNLNILIMAAGLGTRMRSTRAKVLHTLAGQPLINHVYQAALELSPQRILIVIGHQAEKVRETLENFHQRLLTTGRIKIADGFKPEFVLQAEQQGTGHAVMMAQNSLLNDSATLLVLSGDVPLIEAETLDNLIKTHFEQQAMATVLVTQIPDATGYGRVVRNAQSGFSHIVEHRDATATERMISEINAGIYCFESQPLFATLSALTPTNAQGEYYLTDVLRLLVEKKQTVAVFSHSPSEEVLGINNRVELAAAERKLRNEKIGKIMRAGVTVMDPASTFIDANVEIGMDSTIYPNVIIEGNTLLGEHCSIAPGVHIVNAQIGNNVTIRDHCLIVDSTLGDGVTVGPFAHLRMGTHLADGATIGNFVEVKKSTLGKRSKAMHLSYLGDASIGNNVNIGAGTVTCNYDGKDKHPTTIEDDVKIGSDTMLVAPVKVGRGAVTGAGAVVTKDVPERALAVGIPAVVKKAL